MLKAILFAVALLLGADAYANPSSCAWPNCNPNAGFDAVVDITGSADPCKKIQAAFAPWITDRSTSSVYSVRITGTATVASTATPSGVDLGPYDACIVRAMGNSTDSDGYPVLEASAANFVTAHGKLSVFWDNVILNVTGSGQAEDYVVVNNGLGYIYGYISSGAVLAGRVSRDVIDYGELEIVFNTSYEAASWPTGRIPLSSTSGLFESASTIVGWMNNGWQYMDASGLKLTIRGGGSDDDNVGFVSDQTWGTSTGKTTLRYLGTAAIFYGNNIGEFDRWDVSNNNVGLVFGDFRNNVDSPVWSGCVCTGAACGAGSSCTEQQIDTAYGMRFNGMVQESNDYGHIVGVDVGSEIVFDHYRSEADAASMERHHIIFGAGRCGDETGTTEDYKTCGDKDECNTTGVCTMIGSTGAFGRSVTFTNSLIGGDSGWYQAASNGCTAAGAPLPCCTSQHNGVDCEDYDGIFAGLATQYNVTSSVRFTNSSVQYSTKAGTKFVFGATDDSVSQRGMMEFNENYYYDTAIQYPNYKALLSDGTIRYHFEVNAAASAVLPATTTCIPKAGSGAPAAITCSAGTTPQVDYAVTAGQQFYSRGGCIPYSATGWAASDQITLSVQEIGSDGNPDTALGAGIRVPDTGTLTTTYVKYTQTDNVTQALGVIGATDAVAFRLRVTSITDPGGDAVFQGVCWVDVIPVSNSKNQYQYGLP